MKDDTLKIALEQFQRVTDEAISAQDQTDELEVDRLGPQFFVEWVMCEAWFLHLTESVWSACAFLEDLMRKMPKREEASLITV